MKRPGYSHAALLLASALTFSGCNVVSAVTGGDGDPINQQWLHSAGQVLNVQSVRSNGGRTAVKINVMNGGRIKTEISVRDDETYLLTDKGEKLLLLPSASKEAMEIGAGQMADVELIFAGDYPSGQVQLIINQGGQRDGLHSVRPRFEIPLPTSGIGAASVPETSGLSGLSAAPVSTFAPARADASGSGMAGSPSSNLGPVEELKSSLGAVSTERGLLVSLPGDVTFDYDSADIRADAHATLDKLAELVKAGADGQVTIEGHTDAKGDDAYNSKLSAQRADAVKLYLVGKGIVSARLKTIGLGELRPIAPNAKADGSDDADGRQKNRRVEVVLPDGQRAGREAAPTQTIP